MRRLLLTGFLLVLFIVGCSGDSVANDMYEHLEQTVELEQPFAEQQEPFSALEQEEQDLYNQIIELSADEMDKITSLSDEAIATIKERKELLQTELDSMNKAEEEFTKVKEYVEDLDEESKQVAQELVDTMEQRYEAYQQLHDAYMDSLEQDQKLYELFKKEDLKEEDLRNQIETVNQSYDKVMEYNDNFNELTDTYNQLKQDFYDSVELNVVYE
ncbi:YkyA family protein [Gracilibacillus caseinilyticus]|uniref:YkyA family protein n=1 Tax=Gracilibacillus caseinilyticus TaxID=2932256 RepID=A0ABY4EUB3_9BACI|nr:YkyA family protein [Gracilibacillus caseinilyticus]UOQ48007.1 YkyA family protein [Gracilibacillus caseinilyticus]